MMVDDVKEEYRRFSETEPSLPIFSRGWWLDATCGAGNWDVAVVKRGGKIVASMPFFEKKRLWFSVLTQPKLTQKLGPWTQETGAKYVKSLGQTKSALDALIKQLPSFDYFSQSWDFAQTNWLPFFWQGFEQTTAYTYIIPDLSDLDLVWREMDARVRTDIRKAKERAKLIAKPTTDLDAFSQLNDMVYLRQGKRPPYSQAFLRAIDKACADRNCRQIWIVEDGDGKQYAGVYVVWDETSAYYLIGGGDPDLANVGAGSLALWTAIEYCSKVTGRFDFEGSMIRPIEKFVRGFGGKQVPYFRIKKINSPLLLAQQSLAKIVSTVARKFGS